jgi:hypothetical protein
MYLKPHSRLSILLTSSLRPEEKAGLLGKLIVPLCTARATLSPRSYTLNKERKYKMRSTTVTPLNNKIYTV